MEKTKKALSVVLLILCVICIVGSVNVGAMRFEASVLPKILACVAILASLSALYYNFRGFKKHAAPAYSAYMSICALYCMLCNVSMAIKLGGIENHVVIAITIVANTLLVSGYMVLSVSKDIGKGNTFTCCALIIVIVLAQAIAMFVTMSHGTPAMGHDVYGLILNRIICKFVFSLIAIGMATAKYIDKAERGSH